MRTFALLALSFTIGSGAALACGEKSSEAHASNATASETANVSAVQASLDITGMKCGSCAGKIATALTAIEGVETAKVDAETGTATVSYDKSKVDLTALVQAVTDMGEGYTASGVEQALIN